MRGNAPLTRRRGRRALALATLLASAWIPAMAANAADEGGPRLRRVTLSTGGVGLFDFAAEPAPDGTVRLTVPLRQVDDILKSLTVYDAKGVVQGVTLPGATPEADLFRDAPVAEDDLASMPALLGALRGTEVGVAGPTSLRGRVANVAREEATDAQGRVTARHRVGLLTAEGLRSFVLEEAQGLELADAGLRARLERLLDGLASARREQQRELVLSVRDAGGPVGLGYLAEAPLWKATYRLLLDGPPGKEALVQGWAVLENTSGHDWRDVEVTLAAGSPRALRQALYQAYYVDRPEVPVVAGAQDQERKRVAAVPFARSARVAAAPEAAFAAEADAPGPAQALAAPPLAAAVGEELTAQTLYRLTERVRVDAGQSLLAPLVDRRVEVQRVALVTPEQRGPHPRAALRLTNPADASLPPGLVTVYERLGTGALSFAGDASLPATPPGAERLLAYAADGKLEVRTSEARPRRLTAARAAGGVLELVVAERTAVTFEIALEDDAPRRLVVEWDRLADRRVVEPADATVTPGRVRFERDLPGRARTTERLALEREVSRRFVLADTGPDEIVAAIGGGESGLPEPLAGALGRLRELAAEVAAAEAETQRLTVERDRLAGDQERLRANLEGVPAESDLARRYLDRLAASEDGIEALDRSLAQAREALERAAAARRDFVAGLRL